MRVSLSHSEVRKKGTIFYIVHCTIAFTQEEKAIIADRELLDYYIEFESGYVNVPIELAKGPSAEQLRLLYIALGVLGVLILVFMHGPAPLFALTCWGAAIWAFFRYRQRLHKEMNSHEDRLTIGSVIADGGFTLMQPGTPNAAREMEQEITKNLELIKSLMSASAQPLQSKTFEL